MKRFIRYLYEYEQEKRIRNVGFVKVESGDEETVVHMQGKGFHKNGDRKLVLYLFYENNEKLFVIRQGEMELKTPVMNWHLKYTPEEMKHPENYEKIRGVMIETESGRRILATWDDQPVDVSCMEEERQDVKTEGKAEENAEERNDISEGRVITKIGRNDLAKLPRCEWKLANNHFLMHGYHNYHHLVMIKEGNSLQLGVPGIYHIEEEKMAEIFGFAEFRPIEEIEISLDPEEKHQDEPFGYWCRPVRAGIEHRKM